MPTLSVTLTADQSTRVSAALGVSTQADAEAAIKAWLKERVKQHECQVDSNAAYDAARIKVDTDFP